ncbi:L-serine ammonia-lyase [Aeoliella sp. ICT_H6.2]|uniref:L-serine dehydratase n=1 Tax=Aeoliella straminimaris TaxID=2954799 RepID=A0A9X2F790_9BACT|nr:L-serine ammonia-lyase [Aeoliella straminimaris]MCO6042938.1 L-serine ammonia-lyase [Aeoliella straminimaris]
MISILDFFTIGIGPSSSHSVGPMRAAKTFVDRLVERELLERVARLEVTLYGSLALTGKGHGTDKAVLLGLLGETPDGVDVDTIDARIAQIETDKRLTLAGTHAIDFRPQKDLKFDRKTKCKVHPNQLRLVAIDAEGEQLAEDVVYSVGGGFVLTAADIQAAQEVEASGKVPPDSRPYPFRTGAELLARTKETGTSISEVVQANERVSRNEEEFRAEVLKRWQVMQDCVKKGCQAEGILPGGLQVRRRAPALCQKLKERGQSPDPLATLDWVDLFALAVNEENAAGGRVVTAPTNGAAGIIPAVLHYHMRFCYGASEDTVVRFLSVAGAIALLYKENASISGAEVGCQGEVGVAASMAAGALTEVLGGTVEQVLQAAEIAMEHHLGLTCDPIGGLVQVPCIERNAVAAVTAINSSRMALAGDGEHKVSLDKVIATMRRTGADMSAKYKETARGGLAIEVNVIEC